VGTHSKSGSFVLFLFQLVAVAIQESNATRLTVGTHSKSGCFVLFLFQLVAVAIQESHITRLTLGTHSKSGSCVLFLEQLLDVCKRDPVDASFLMMMMVIRADREEMNDTKERMKNGNVYCIER
jgi:hypothetical protein